MAFDIFKFLRDHNIDHTTEGARAKHGWVQMHCPFCGGSSRGYDLGFKIDGGYFVCWQCKGKNALKVIRTLTGCGFEEAKRMFREYEGKPTIRVSREMKEKNRVICTLPPECGPMMERHDRYLEDRKFDPALLEHIYDLRGTGRVGSYRHRIIAPIYFEGRLVSYQGRDITENSDLRYKACRVERETIHHKHVLYAWDLAKGDSCGVVEGITDVWRLGPDMLGTFGTGYTKEQLNLLIKRFKRVFLIFDPEPAAQKEANEIAWALGLAGREAILVDLDEEGVDPGDMRQDDADALMRQLGLKGWNHD